MEDEEYELVSHDEVERLKREVERLKSNPFVKNADDLKLYEAVQDLNNSVNRLFVLFESVNKQLLKEYQSGNSPDQKLDKIMEQNRNIAEALVAFGSNIGDSQQSNSQSTESMSTAALSQIPLPSNVSTMQQMPASQPMQSQAQFMQQPKPMQQPQFTAQSAAKFMPAPPLPPMQSPMPQMQNQMREQNFQSQEAPLMQGQTIQTQGQPNLFNDPIAMQGFRGATSQMSAQPARPLMQQQNDPFQNQFNRPSQPPLPPQRTQSEQQFLDANYPMPDRFSALGEQPSMGEPIDVKPKKKGLFSR